jgi:hypothetical protein
MSALSPKATEIANISRREKGRADGLCPARSNVDLLGCNESVVNVDAEVAHSTFNLGVTEKELHGAQIPRAAIDQRCFGSPQ